MKGMIGMTALARRRMQEKELCMAGDMLGTQQELEHNGLIFMGSTGTAAKAGYLTARGCQRLGVPVTEDELAHPQYFAMMPDCYSDLCVTDQDGDRRRPCLPVFYRGDEGTEAPP